MTEPPLLATAARISRRELRGGLRGFGVFVTALFLGVFAIAAVGSFTASARLGLLADAAAILGGDIEVRVVHRPLAAEPLESLVSYGAVSAVASLRTMAFAAEGDARGLVELKAVDRHYPLYGEVRVEPPQALTTALATGVLVEESLLLRFDLAVGDRLRLGEATFEIAGVLAREPDRVVRAFTLGPRVMVSQAGLEKTGLIQPGSLVRYGYRLRLADPATAEKVKRTLLDRHPEAGWRVRTWREAAPRIRSFLDRMGTNLTLLGLCALLVGGLGVSGAVRGYLDSKLLHIATMKCVGASGRTVFFSYLLQILFIGGLAAAAGLTVAAALPFLAARVIGERLPIPFEPALFADVLLTAALFGLLIALLFSLRSLTVASRVPPAILFRGYSEAVYRKIPRRQQVVIGLVAVLLVVLTVGSSDDRRMAVWFVLGAGGCFALFRVATAAVVRLTARLPRPRDPRLALALRNIGRRGSPARSVMFSLGLGLTALVLIALVQANLTALVEGDIPQDAPAFFFLDIQPDQIAAFDALVAQNGQVQKSRRFPTLRGRITSLKGVPVDEASIDPDVRWAVRGDRYLSYAAELPAGTRLVAGEWWDGREADVPRVSITADLAEGFHMKVGDRLGVNVLGREIVATVTSIREVDWSNLQLNFALLFAPGLLEDAPQTHIAAVHLPPAAEAPFYRAVTDRFPNVSVIGVREVLANVSRTLSRLGAAFSAMAAVALAVSLLVLAGALSADQHRRIHDSVIFKVCGAVRTDIVLTFAFEFLLLGACAGAIALIAGSLAAYGILTRLMDAEFVLYPGVVAVTLAVSILLTLVLGLSGTWKALGQKPSGYLREGLE